MLSAIVVAPQGTQAIAVVRTLAALVPAAVQGLVRDVTLAGPAEAAFADIADHAGCHVSMDANLAIALAGALAAARETWVLLLLAGYAPEAGFVDEMGDFMAVTGRAGLLRAVPGHWITRQFPALAPIAGVLASRAMLAGTVVTASSLRLAAKPRQTLHVRARRVI